jgi:hypothetical protein
MERKFYRRTGDDIFEFLVKFKLTSVWMRWNRKKEDVIQREWAQRYLQAAFRR